MNLFMFKGRLYRKIARPHATIRTEAVPDHELEHLLQVIDDSFNESNLAVLDNIQQSYQKLINGEILRRDR